MFVSHLVFELQNVYITKLTNYSNHKICFFLNKVNQGKKK